MSHKQPKTYPLLALLCLLTSLSPIVAEELGTGSPWLPERRQDQSRTSKGHILTPAAANIPGFGFFYGIIGGLFNVLGSESDAFAYRFWGEISGGGIGLVDTPLLNHEMTLNVFYNIFNQASIETHRRTVHSNPDDAIYQRFDFFEVTLAQINYRLFERRLQLNLGINRQRENIEGLYDSEGEKISPMSSQSDSRFSFSYGVIADFTDDRADPREGAILEAFRYDKEDPGKEKPFYFNMDYNVLYHIPFLTHSTLVFNYYRSDAILHREGELNSEAVRSDLGLGCEALSGEEAERCSYHEANLIADQLAANRHGTSVPIGGTQRLQAYPTNRFVGAHTQTFGTEARINMTQEFSPFNIGILSGIRTGVQFAFFYEKGIATDKKDELLNIDRYKPSYGGGIRFILASGFIVRMDLASGPEGNQPVLIFQYPWNVF
ncbi:MAG: hypothetical protein HRU09_03215 [Oligoflexales bacterium]|nr:hypothetical protein [Oligoflexales bacterium]